MKITLLSPADALTWWPTLSEYLKKAMDTGQGESNLTDYMKKILNEQAHCWAIINDNKIVGVGLTEILQYSQHKTLHIIAYSGDSFEEQANTFPHIEEFARKFGCSAIEQWGRPGWAKVLPQYVPGFKQAYVVMRKEI
jgi:hypothetical protein